MPSLSKLVAAVGGLALLFASSTADSVHAPKPNLSAAGNDDARIQAFRSQLDATRQRLGIPGMSAVILENGKVLWSEGFGYADLENKVPATPETLYHIASVTKTFTAILVHRLVEQGKLDLDDPVMRYTDEVKDPRIKVKHLLSHTADGVPGTAFNYNPDQFEHLKALLETVAGKSLREQMQQTFLDPLDMSESVPGPDVANDDHTWAVLGADHLARYRKNLAAEAKGYIYWGNGEIVFSGSPQRDFWASAGMMSTVRDLAKYDAAIDDHRLLSQATLDKAWTPFVSNAGKPLAFGLGWYVTDYRGERLIAHYGHWGTSFSALYMKVPARHLTMILLANTEALADHHYKVGEDVSNDRFACSFLDTFIPGIADGVYSGSHPLPANLDAVLADKQARNAAAAAAAVADSPTKVSTDCDLTSRVALANWLDERRAKAQARKPIPLDPKLAAEYAGHYQFSRTLDVTNENGHLFINVPRDGGHAEMFAQSPTQFFLKIRDWDMTFIRENGKVVRLDIADSGQTVQAKRVD